MSEKLDAIFSGRRSPGVYRWEPEADLETLRAQAEGHGWLCFHLDGRRIADKHEFIEACARAMRFPAYFGKNWDALEESLRDLDWAPAPHGYLVLYDHAGRFAARRPDEFATALAILRSTARHWSATSTPMAVLIGGLGQEGRAIPEL